MRLVGRMGVLLPFPVMLGKRRRYTSRIATQAISLTLNTGKKL